MDETLKHINQLPKLLSIKIILFWLIGLVIINMVASSVPPKILGTNYPGTAEGVNKRLLKEQPQVEVINHALMVQDAVIEGELNGHEVKQYRSLIKIPPSSDPGYVKLKLQNTHYPHQVSVKITADHDQQGAILNGPFSGSNLRNITAYFSAQPGVNYSVSILPQSAEQPGISKYKLSWKFVEMSDEHEPNDNQLEASTVSFNKTIQAYAIAGHAQNVISSSDRQVYDWYKVKINSTKRIKAQILDAPEDLQLQVVLYDIFGNKLTAFSDFDLISRLPRITSTKALPPGTYYLAIYPVSAVVRKAIAEIETVPQHFNRPYKFVLSQF